MIFSNLKKMLLKLWHSELLQYFIPAKIYVSVQYKHVVGKKLNLKNPVTFNEKLQWLKLHDKNEMCTQLVDKYEVRKHIAQTLGKKYLIPLIGVYKTFDEIKFEELPNEFVLKCTHDSGGFIICNDKKKLNIELAKEKICSCLKKNYYYKHREWPYKNVKPRIMCEKYMVDDSGTELKDYKFMCFNGKVKCSFVCLNRNSTTGLNVDFYDMDWNLMPFERHYPNSGIRVPKPKNFTQMVKFAEILSTGIPFVRVDFYETNGQLYFGEITFYPGSGYEEFTPASYDKLLGSWLELPINLGEH
ncbi:MAG: glycosyl transferase [Firmicutes bacterium HGW-Firmicutes-8]|nr:MAG: glycosyl transferase [Firmicutes bacterium HGW-Firmicutes-8]